MPIGLGIVGYGGFGAFTADVYARMDEVRIVALTDTDANRLAEGAQRYQARAYPDLEHLLQDSEVELVAISTPPWLHVPQALAAVEAGKHVFLEKPLATTLEDADRLLKRVREQGVRLSVDYVLRRIPIYRTLQKLIKSRLLGDIAFLRLENVASNEALHADHWFWDRSRSGGIFIEHGVHFFDLGNQLCGVRPETVTAYARNAVDGRQDRVLSAVSYENGVLASFYHAFDRPAILEQTVLRVGLDQGNVTVYGWIPEQMDVRGLLPEEQRGALATLLGTDLNVLNLPAPEGITGATAGQVVEATLTSTQRTADYQEAIRLGMADLVRSILDPHYTPEVTLEDAYDSFRLAYLSQRSLETGQSLSF